jgi:poly(ADP-ribose) glycohydrolase ARH3
VLQALAVAEAVLSSGHDLDPQTTIGQLRRQTVHPLLRDRLERVSKLVAGGSIVQALGNGVTAHEAVPAARAVFLRHSNAFGGDTDTIASMTGALVGARLGAEAIPREWCDRLEDARIRVTADLLFELWELRAAG